MAPGRGTGGDASPSEALLLGLLSLTLGLAILSKATAIGLALVVALALLRYAPPGEGLVRRLGRAVGVLGGAFLVGGWWYVRLWLLYRDPLGTAARDVALGRTSPFTVSEGITDLGQLGLTFVARFGQTNLAPPLAVSLAYLAVVVVGFIPGVRAVVRAHRPAAVLQLVWIAAILVLFYVWQVSVPGPQGRLVFPALGSIAVVWALGVDALVQGIPVPGRRSTLLALGVAGLVGALAFPVLLIGPAYRPRPDRLLAQLPATARAVSISFGEEVDLVGYELPRDATSNGTLRLFWRRGARPDAGLSFFVHAVDPTGRVVSSADSALAPSTPLLAWPTTGTVEIDVTLHPPLATGSTEHLDVGTYRIVDGAIRPVPVGQTEATSQTLAGLQPGAPPRLEDQPIVARFGQGGGETIDLLGWSLDAAAVRSGGQLDGRLLWSAPGPVRTDYTVFVHVLREGKLIAQYDAPPVHGFFPTTAWPPGLTVSDAFVVPLPADLPPGPAQVALGLYDAKTLQRLPLSSGESLNLTTIDVRK